MSGGQTGVDRVALDIAIELQVGHGGWCPCGRRAEDGVIDARYQLVETESKNYAIRTRKNIEDSDGTLVFSGLPLVGGTQLTVKLAKEMGRPVKVIFIAEKEVDQESTVEETIAWIVKNKIRILNVAGPRSSSNPDLPMVIRPVLESVFSLARNLRD